MSRRPFNVLLAPPAAAPRAQLPWPVILATLVFLVIMGRELEAWRQQLTSLRYEAAQGLASRAAPAPGRDPDPDAPGRHALSAELTYPWDQVLNLAGQAEAPVQWTLLDAGADGDAMRLQVQAADAGAFWTWLGTLRKNPAITTATATSGQAENGRMVFDVAITWRRGQ